MKHTSDMDFHGETSPLASDAHCTLFERYRIVETRATGGFGYVFVAWDARLHRRVAIKKLPFAQTDDFNLGTNTLPEALTEARTACLLSHPNIVTVFDFEFTNNAAYLVMEFIDGISLSDLLKRVEGGVLTFDECAHVVNSIADALTFAHSNGVFHLDVKPQNILIDRSGRVLLSDFGMASLTNAAHLCGARGGTVGYMPPEQLRGLAVDKRSDLFSLGVVCYESIAGFNPFAAHTVQASLTRIEQGARPLFELDAELDPLASDAIMQALEPGIQFRPDTIEDFMCSLRPHLGNANAGKRSLCTVLTQTFSNEDSDDESCSPLHPYEDTGNEQHHSQVITVILRILTALCSGWITWLCLSVLPMPQLPIKIFLSLGATGLGATLPALGSGLLFLGLIGLVACELPHTQEPTAFIAAATMIVGCGAWWISTGRTTKNAPICVLLPACVGVPDGSVALSAFLLPVFTAGITASFGWFLTTIVQLLAQTYFALTPFSKALNNLATSPYTWIGLIGSGCSASLGAYLRNKIYEQKRAIITSQIICILLLIVCRFLMIHMESSRTWTTYEVASLIFAVIFPVVILAVTLLATPSQNLLKGDKREFSERL